MLILHKNNNAEKLLATWKKYRIKLNISFSCLNNLEKRYFGFSKLQIFK